MSDIHHIGFLYDDSGDPIVGATVQAYVKDSCTTAGSSTTTNSDGKWSITTTSDNQLDIKITSGSSVRFRKFSDAIQVSELEVGTFNIREAQTAQVYTIAPGSISADRTLTLPAATGSDTLASLGLAQTFSAAQTYSAGIVSTAAANTLGTTSFNDAAITNVSDIALDSISADGTDINIAMDDNSATALTIKQGSDAYLIMDTANSSESVSIGTGISGTAITIGHSTSETTVADNLTVTGDMTVNGTTTTVNSTTLTVDDPIITLGGDTAPGSDDNKDRGVEFRYHDGSCARIGFFGYDDSASVFTGFTVATNSSEVFSGTVINATFGAIEGTALTVDDVAVNGKVVTMTGSACDTIVMTAAANGAFSLVTTDTAATAANIQITADGTVDIDSAGVLTLDSGAAINLEPAVGSAILLDGTISIDGAAITGATSILATDIKIGEDDQTKIDFEDANTINFYANNAKDLVLSENALTPGTSDGTALGTTSLMWSDAFLASGAVVNFNNGDVTLTHSACTLTVAGGTLAAAAITGTTIDATTDFTIGTTVITDDVITFTPTSSDTVVMTATTNGAFSIVTTDDNAAAANITITADGTVDINSAGVLTLDSGAAINIEPAACSVILLDGTISIDAGVVTGATSITSTAFLGTIDGVVGGNTPAAITGTTLTVDNFTLNGTELDLSSGDFALDVAGDIEINADGGCINFKDGSLALAAIVNTSCVGELRIHEAANYVGFKAPALSANQIWTLPAADGNACEVLTCNGSGVLSWAAGGSGIFGQILQDTLLTAFTTTCTSFTAITGLSQAITLASTCSKVLVSWHVNGAQAYGVARTHLRLMRGCTAIAVGTKCSNQIPTTGSFATSHCSLVPSPVSGSYIDSPGSESELIYSMQVRTAGNVGTSYINRSQAFNNDTGTGNYQSSITLIEIL